MEELNNQQSIETTDNSSDVDVSAEVSKALDEPEAKIEPTKVSTKDNIDDVKQTETQCPEKFKNGGQQLCQRRTDCQGGTG